jgi:hypothetical protein
MLRRRWIRVVERVDKAKGQGGLSRGGKRGGPIRFVWREEACSPFLRGWLNRVGSGQTMRANWKTVRRRCMAYRPKDNTQEPKKRREESG